MKVKTPDKECMELNKANRKWGTNRRVLIIDYDWRSIIKPNTTQGAQANIENPRRAQQRSTL
jgi:hypothetical protein